tara:strand:- start:187 stop:1488 length:1302 start_codon:yes stop_codon:yes gene_type:complete
MNFEPSIFSKYFSVESLNSDLKDTNKKSRSTFNSFLNIDQKILNSMIIASYVSQNFVRSSISNNLSLETITLLQDILAEVELAFVTNSKESAILFDLDLKQEHIQYIENFAKQISVLIDIDSDFLFLQLKVYFDILANQFSEEYAMMLFRADLQSEDALMSFFDNAFAMKGATFVKDESYYTETSDEVMHPNSFFHVFGSEKIIELQSMFKKPFEKKDYLYFEQAVLPTILELIISEELLMDRLPLGILNYFLLCDVAIFNKSIFEFSFVICHENMPVLKLNFHYNVVNHTCLIIENKKNIGSLVFSFDLSNQFIRSIGGEFRGNVVAIVVRKKLNNFYFKLIMSHWKGRLKQVNKFGLFGRFFSTNGIDKSFKSFFKADYFMDEFFSIIKHIDIGEDHVVVKSLFHKEVPFPIFMTGVIRNNTYIPSEIILL